MDELIMTEANGMEACDTQYMKMALGEADRASAAGDIPVGAVLVRHGAVIAAACNTREAEQTVVGHAEMNVMMEACRKLGSKWLTDCTLYVTLEPCPMCTGAILQARIPRVVFGAYDPVAGAMGSVWVLHRWPVESKIEVIGGVLEEECRGRLQGFFQRARQES